MSFSSETKTALCNSEINKSCCKRALLSGMLAFSNIFQWDKIKLITENKDTAELYTGLLKELYDIDTNEYVSEKHTTDEGERITHNSYKITAVSAKRLQPLRELVPSGAPSFYRINENIFKCESCRRMFIRGAFLASGTISDPKASYHLEISTPYTNLTKDIMKLLEEVGFPPRTTVRKSSNVIYYKDSEQIVDFLNAIGATNAAFEVINRKIMKEYRNNANRRVNFETANIEKTVNACNEINNLIKYLIDSGEINQLDAELQKTAHIRYDNPGLSLSELAAIFEPPISKSGLSHRLRRITAFANERMKK